jgi:hypothetical protein
MGGLGGCGLYRFERVASRGLSDCLATFMPMTKISASCFTRCKESPYIVTCGSEVSFGLFSQNLLPSSWVKLTNDGVITTDKDPNITGFLLLSMSGKGPVPAFLVFE